MAEVLTIDCDECALQGTAACEDCVVTHLCGGVAATAVVIDMAEARAVRLLGDAGLVPSLRHRDRVRVAGSGCRGPEGPR
ncbi:MAG TPA: hypothetical protein VM262_15320 [Acidimicrobiales bacterium]|nr:hypothetical protein [Acidimicrobiales bacterium]